MSTAPKTSPPPASLPNSKTNSASYVCWPTYALGLNCTDRKCRRRHDDAATLFEIAGAEREHSMSGPGTRGLRIDEVLVLDTRGEREAFAAALARPECERRVLFVAAGGELVHTAEDGLLKRGAGGGAPAPGAGAEADPGADPEGGPPPPPPGPGSPPPPPAARPLAAGAAFDFARLPEDIAARIFAEYLPPCHVGRVMIASRALLTSLLTLPIVARLLQARGWEPRNPEAQTGSLKHMTKLYCLTQKHEKPKDPSGGVVSYNTARISRVSIQDKLVCGEGFDNGDVEWDLHTTLSEAFGDATPAPVKLVNYHPDLCLSVDGEMMVPLSRKARYLGVRFWAGSATFGEGAREAIEIVEGKHICVYVHCYWGYHDDDTYYVVGSRDIVMFRETPTNSLEYVQHLAHIVDRVPMVSASSSAPSDIPKLLKLCESITNGPAAAVPTGVDSEQVGLFWRYIENALVITALYRVDATGQSKVDNFKVAFARRGIHDTAADGKEGKIYEWMDGGPMPWPEAAPICFRSSTFAKGVGMYEIWDDPSLETGSSSSTLKLVLSDVDTHGNDEQTTSTTIDSFEYDRSQAPDLCMCEAGIAYNSARHQYFFVGSKRWEDEQEQDSSSNAKSSDRSKKKTHNLKANRSTSDKKDPPPSSRRSLLTKVAFGVASAAAPAVASAYELPDLPYDYAALEPYIDAPTMKFHHDKHHMTYLTNINKAMEGKEQPSLVDLQTDALSATPIRNSGGGHYNHAFFWDEMEAASKASKTAPSPALLAAINKSFGSLDEMKAKWSAAAAPGAVFGSGWVWLVLTAKDELQIVGTPNQDNPLMKGVLADGVAFPVLGLDVWEHAYYLNYQNRRPDYVSAWWNVVNWDKVNANYDYVLTNHKGVPVRG
ncbi:hypothetical protein TeGR_g820 [Tetraparma gracilis]|uniref:Superoxide dismutase [Fe] n=1 Tax=Tetraparma gracilis TaxID=2962635 RepID=A0ABQ6MCS6_9STRA|nr:hypothetical protein TeGR_g820 [Tetraparma gracilis]